MIDVFAILLMIIGSQNQFYFDSAPVVAREQSESKQQTPHQPLVVELADSGPLVDNATIDWPSLEARFARLEPTRRIIVRAQCDGQGHGPLAHLMQIGFIAQRTNVASRLFVVTRQPD